MSKELLSSLTRSKVCDKIKSNSHTEQLSGIFDQYLKPGTSSGLYESIFPRLKQQSQGNHQSTQTDFIYTQFLPSEMQTKAPIASEELFQF